MKLYYHPALTTPRPIVQFCAEAEIRRTRDSGSDNRGSLQTTVCDVPPELHGAGHQ